MLCEALLGLCVHDGLAIAALRRGEGLRATVEGHWKAVGILHARWYLSDCDRNEESFGAKCEGGGSCVVGANL